MCTQLNNVRFHAVNRIPFCKCKFAENKCACAYFSANFPTPILNILKSLILFSKNIANNDNAPKTNYYFCIQIFLYNYVLIKIGKNKFYRFNGLQFLQVTFLFQKTRKFAYFFKSRHSYFKDKKCQEYFAYILSI